MKKWTAFMLSLLLLLSPVLCHAAPTRDMGDMEIMVSEPLQHMLNLLFSAAMIEDVTALNAAEQVPAAFQDTLFALFGYVEGDEGSLHLDGETASQMYRMFFADGTCDASYAGGRDLDLARFDEMPLAGAYVHESHALGDGTLTLKMDLYTLWGYFSTPAEWVPEGDLTWWAGAECVLNMDETSPYGYAVSSFSIGMPYMDGLAADWQLVENVKMEYSVRLPAILGLADDTIDRTVYQSADGESTVYISCTPGMSYEDALDAFVNAHPDMLLTQQEELFTFTAVKNGAYAVCVAEESLPYVYTLYMEFPAERQMEYTLYADLIRNSLAVWGLNNG